MIFHDSGNHPLDILHIQTILKVMKATDSDKVEILAFGRKSIETSSSEEFLEFKSFLRGLKIDDVIALKDGSKAVMYDDKQKSNHIFLSVATRGKTTDFVIFQTYDSAGIDIYT